MKEIDTIKKSLENALNGLDELVSKHEEILYEENIWELNEWEKADDGQEPFTLLNVSFSQTLTGRFLSVAYRDIESLCLADEVYDFQNTAIEDAKKDIMKWLDDSYEDILKDIADPENDIIGMGWGVSVDETEKIMLERNEKKKGTINR